MNDITKILKTAEASKEAVESMFANIHELRGKITKMDKSPLPEGDEEAFFVNRGVLEQQLKRTPIQVKTAAEQAALDDLQALAAKKAWHLDRYQKLILEDVLVAHLYHEEMVYRLKFHKFSERSEEELKQETIAARRQLGELNRQATQELTAATSCTDRARALYGNRAHDSQFWPAAAKQHAEKEYHEAMLLSREALPQ